MGGFSQYLMAAAIWNFIFPISLAVERNCDYTIDLIVGKEYAIYNREFPQKYKSSTNCRWQMKSSQGTRIVLSCTAELPLVESHNPFFFNSNSKDKCQYQDKVLVSATGNKNVADGHSYCGNATFNSISDKNSMSVALLAISKSSGGKFSCGATAIEVDSPVPTQNDTLSALATSCDCGWRFLQKIVGGQETGINEFPAMALLVLGSSNEFCGATIISDRYALTAAHCVYNRDFNDMTIIVGDHNISTGAETPAQALYEVSAYEYYPSYNPSTMANDIAIVQTATTITFSSRVGPICLPFRYTGSTFYGQIVTVLGWGLTEFTGPTSDVLLKANLNVITNLECANAGTGVTITSSLMCTYAPGKDACQKDSGGPLLWTDSGTNRLHLVGVISQGLGCGSSLPSVNVRVTTYLSWIVSRTSEVAYCIR